MKSAVSTQENKFRPWLILTAAGALAYANSFSGPFVFDDLDSIPDNPTIRRLWPIGPIWHPPESAGVGGRPLLNLSFALNHALGGNAVAGYHAVNLLIHVLAAALLFAVLRRTFSAVGGSSPGLALALAVLWEIHPVQTASVTYVSQRAESLMGLFYLLGLYGLIRAATAPRPWPWLTIAVLAAWGGAATKEVIVTLPVVALLYDRTFLAGSFREAWRRRGGFYAALASSWLLIALLVHGLNQRGVGYIHGVTPFRYLLTESEVILRYVGLVVWPHPLVLDYGTWYAVRPAIFIPASALVLSGLIGAGILLWRRPPLGFLAAAFFLLLAPTSSFVPIAAAPMGENRLYLPLAVVLILAGIGVHAWLGRRAAWAAALVGTVWLGLTIRRNADYRTELGLWAVTVAQRPENGRAHYEYANALLKAGSLAPAIAQYALAAQLSPGWPEARTAWAQAEFDQGNAWREAGRGADAKLAYEAALKVRPEFPEALLNLGALELAAGETQAAVAHLRAAVRLKPDDGDARYDLEIAERRLGR